MNFDSNYKQQRKIIYAQLSLSFPTLFSHFFYVTFVAFLLIMLCSFLLQFSSSFLCTFWFVDCFGFILNFISTICVAHLRRSTTTDDDDDDELPHLPQTPANSAAHSAHNKRRDKIFCSVRPINRNSEKKLLCVSSILFIYNFIEEYIFVLKYIFAFLF